MAVIAYVDASRLKVHIQADFPLKRVEYNS